jgi:hypothetical protein
MEVVFRPVNDAFLHQVVFPALERGVVDAVPGIQHLVSNLGDDHTRAELELLLERGVEGSFFGLEDPRWSTSIYKLLFNEWTKGPNGWTMSGEQLVAYAGDWENTLHLTLMLEEPGYPYQEDARAAEYRQNFVDSPFVEQGLATLACGLWNPVPAFPPDQILTDQGRGDFRPEEGVARADWAWRPLHVVNKWAALLPNQLSRLLEREARRLKPIEAPERHDVLQYWLGRIEEPPVLAVTFSGLGPGSNEWIREIGQLARMLRKVAEQQKGLTAVIDVRGGGIGV